MKTYCDRVWLNPPTTRSTGSVVAFDGMVDYGDSEKREERTTFLEVADCHGKINLHRGYYDTNEMFIEKLKTLRNVVDNFIEHLTGLED